MLRQVSFTTFTVSALFYSFHGDDKKILLSTEHKTSKDFLQIAQCVIEMSFVERSKCRVTDVALRFVCGALRAGLTLDKAARSRSRRSLLDVLIRTLHVSQHEEK